MKVPGNDGESWDGTEAAAFLTRPKGTQTVEVAVRHLRQAMNKIDSIQWTLVRASHALKAAATGEDAAEQCRRSLEDIEQAIADLKLPRL